MQVLRRGPFAWRQALRGRLGALRRDRAGVAAVEFAVILPLMLVFYLGTVEVTQAIRANAKVASVADTIGNLVTRLKTIDDTSLGNIFAISSAIMNPFPTADLTLTVTAVRIDGQGKGTVHWSKGDHGTSLKSGDPYSVPASLQPFVNSYFVVSTASYAYKPSVRYTGAIGAMTLVHSNVFRPRKSLEVTPK